MVLRRTISILFAVLLASACGNCGGNNGNNGESPDAGNNGTDGGAYTDEDSVSTLSDSQRRAVCEDVIGASGEPGEEIDCGEGVVITLPAISDCADDLAAQPECVTVAAYSNCSEKLAACDPDVFDDPQCYFLTHDSCAPVTDDTSVADLSDGETQSLCEDLVSAVEGGPGEKECSATELRDVPNVEECVAKVESIKPCATVGMLRGCFEDYASCSTIDREECWFFIGDDGGCTAPYAGFERQPSTISVFPPVPVSCDMPGPRQRIPFVIGTTDVFPLVPGDLVNGLPIIPGATFDSGSLAVRRSRVSELTTIPCTSDLDCGDGFRCAASGLVGATRYCTRQNPVTFVPQTMQLDYEPGVTEDQQQLVGVLIENTVSLEGRLPTASGALFENGEKDLLVDEDRATDPTLSHRGMIADFLLNLASVADGSNTRVSIFWYGGQVTAEARPLINPMELEDHFTNDLSVGEALIDSMPTPVTKPANLFQGIQAMMDKDFGLQKYSDHEKFLFVFTDGANEVYDEMATYETILQEAQGMDLHIFIVHLDAEVEPSLIRDVPTYWAGNSACQDDAQCMGAPPCGSNADCANFETCRPAKVYGETENDPVTDTPVSYCMPSYNTEGRLGPIDYYADLACRTGGNYMYVTEPNQMRSYWTSLASVVNGQFSVVGDFAALESADFPAGFYRQAGVFLGIVGTSDLGMELSAPVDSIDVDNRAIIRLER